MQYEESTQATTLEELNFMQLNLDTQDEFKRIKLDPIGTAMKPMEEHIRALCHASGRKIRIDRKEMMISVLRILYTFMFYSEDGECSPSMRTIASYIRPDLERIQETDSPELAKIKDREMSGTLMAVQRAIKSLSEAGILTIHHYRAETNQCSTRNPNFYYQLTPVSTFSKWFADLVDEVLEVCSRFNRFILRLKDAVLFTEQRAALKHGYSPTEWAFPPLSGQRKRLILFGYD